MAKQYRSETQDTRLRQVAVIQSMIVQLKQTSQILKIDIATEEERARVFDPSASAYPILARTLSARRNNLRETIAALEARLSTVTASIPAPVAEAA